MTSLTTAIGFISLYFSQIRILRDFAIFSSFGVLIEYFVTIILMPIMFYFLPKKEALLGNSKNKSYLNNLSDFILKNNKKIVFLSFILMALFIYGIFLIDVDTYTIKFFKKNKR